MNESAPDNRLESLGYKQSFRRVLTRWDLILYGLVILTPTAPYPVYGIIQQKSMGHASLAYLVAMVAMMFTAFSYGKMSGAYPTAGSTYTYAGNALNEHVGFLAGWAMILDYFLIPLLSVIYCALTLERLVPQVPYLAWALLVTVAITAINVRGIKVTAQASTAMMAIMTAVAILFVVVLARFVTGQHGAAALLDMRGFYRPDDFHLRALMLGAGTATLSYIGFDAISTLAEDTLHPEKDIAVATVLVCVLQTVFCVATVYLATLAWPDYKTMPRPETGIIDVAQAVGGNWMLGIMTFVLIVAGVASALTGQAGASRLLFGMSRDGVLPKLFAYINPKYSTPTRGIYLMGGISTVGAIAMNFDMAVELLNFGALAGFILVNLSVIRHYYMRGGQRRGMHFLTNLVFPALGALVCTYVWMSLTLKARLVGFVWLGVGVIYLGVLTRGFRVKPKKLESLVEETAGGN